MLYEAAVWSGGGESELQEVERELQAAHAKPANSGGGGGGGNAAEMGGIVNRVKKESGGAAHAVMNLLRKTVSPVFLEAFTLTFLAEWGDRSQIATIGVAAASNVVGVTVGGILGHSLCTGAAVLGGKHLASHIDERMVTIFGGVLFVLFGMHSLWSGVEE